MNYINIWINIIKVRKKKENIYEKIIITVEILAINIISIKKKNKDKLN